MDEQTKHDDTSLFGTDFDAIDKFIISSLSDFYHTYKDTSKLIYEDTHKPVQESDLRQRFKSSESNLYDLSRKYEDNPPGAYDKPVLLSKNIYEVGAYFHRLDEATGFMGGPSKMGESLHSFIRKLEDIQRLKENMQRLSRRPKDTGLWVYFLLLGLTLILAAGSALPIVPDFFSALLSTNLLVKLILFIPAVLTGFGLFSLSSMIMESDVNAKDKVHTFPIKVMANGVFAAVVALGTPAIIFDYWNHGVFDPSLLWIPGAYYVLLSLAGFLDDCFVPKRKYANAVRDYEAQKSYLCSNISSFEKCIRCYITLHKHLWEHYAPEAFRTDYPPAFEKLQDSLAYLRALRDNGGEYLPPPAKYPDPLKSASSKKPVKKAAAPKQAPAAKPAAKFCSKCGNKLKNGDKFCSKCGTHV